MDEQLKAKLEKIVSEFDEYKDSEEGQKMQALLLLVPDIKQMLDMGALYGQYDLAKEILEGK